MTFGSGGRRSIQLSYARSVPVFARKGIRRQNGGQRATAPAGRSERGRRRFCGERIVRFAPERIVR